MYLADTLKPLSYPYCTPSRNSRLPSTQTTFQPPPHPPSPSRLLSPSPTVQAPIVSSMTALSSSPSGSAAEPGCSAPLFSPFLTDSLLCPSLGSVRPPSSFEYPQETLTSLLLNRRDLHSLPLTPLAQKPPRRCFLRHLSHRVHDLGAPLRPALDVAGMGPLARAEEGEGGSV